MGELDKILATSALTILGGLLIFSITQTLLIYFFEPLKNYRQLLGEIEDALVFYANVFLNPGTPPRGVMLEAQKKLRRLASQLAAKAYAIRPYKLIAWMQIVPSWENIIKAHSNLIGLSNSVFLQAGMNSTQQASHNSVLRKEIRIALYLLPLE